MELNKSKSYYLWLAQRQIGVSDSHLSSWPLKLLKDEVEDTDEDWQKYYRSVTTSKWWKQPLKVLQQQLEDRGLKYKGDRAEAVLTLEHTLIQPNPSLDQDQRQVIEATDKHIIAYAGPGAGKTTMLCAKAAKVYKEGKSILFLVYTKAAQAAIRTKIRRYGVRVSSINRINYYRKNQLPFEGILVSTFHQYAYQRAPGQVKSFQQTLDKGTKAGIQSWEQWDLLIVDELQDIKIEQEALLAQVESIAAQTIYAGDVRQQIYSGARFMELAWDNDKYKRYPLRYNHRSGKKIVELLNIFSKANFGRYHIDQIATREDEGSVGAIIVQDDPIYQTIGHKVGQICSEVDISADEISYCVSPVSVRKFKGTAEIVTSIRQSVHHFGGYYVKVLESGVSTYKPEERVTYVGSSYMLKGSEADKVVVIQSDVPYDQYIATKVEIARLVYVALSRARNKLHIILDREIDNEGVMKSLSSSLKIATVSCRFDKPMQLPTEVKVTDELLELPITANLERSIDIKPILSRSTKAPDFLGLLVESKLASSVGLKPPSEIDVLQDREISITGYTFRNNETLVVKHRPNVQLTKFFDSIANQKPTEYLVAQIKLSLMAGTEWTLSHEFKDVKFPRLSLYAHALGVIGGKYQYHNKYRKVSLRPHRSPWWSGELGRVIGIPDLESEVTEKSKGVVIEIKHARPDMRHTKQLLNYSIMTAKAPVLVNTLEGKINLYSFDYKPSWWCNYTRAVLAMKQASSARLHGRQFVRTNQIKSDLLVVVDVEHSSDNKVLEIGAVIISRSNRNVIDIFHCLSDGVEPNREARPPPKQFRGVNSLCGFKRSKIDRKASNRSITKFKDWLKDYDGYTLVQWAGSDSKLLQMTTHSVYTTGDDTSVAFLDGHQLYKRWLKLNHRERSTETGLESAVMGIFGPRFFSPHRAYEDAVATASVVMAIIKN